MASPYTCDMDRDRRHLVSLAIMAASFAAVLVLAPLRPGGWLEIATWCFFVSLPFAAAYPIMLRITRYGGYQPADMPSITLAVAAITFTGGMAALARHVTYELFWFFAATLALAAATILITRSWQAPREPT